MLPSEQFREFLWLASKAKPAQEPERKPRTGPRISAKRRRLGFRKARQ